MNNGSKHKMYDYEVTPPPGVWEKIVAELNESDLTREYPTRLREMEMTPPPAAWNKIAASLYAEDVPIIPVRRKISPFLRYAAAAAVLAFFAWGGLRLLNNSGKGKKDQIVIKNDPPVKSPVNTTDQPTTVKPDDIVVKSPAEEENARNEAALEESKKTYAKLTTPARTKIKDAAGFHFTLDDPMPPVDVDPATRYITLMTPDGNIIRMSKKLSDLVCCVSGEEQDADCIDQLKKWREKVAASSIAYSPGNFGDILNLVKELQEF